MGLLRRRASIVSGAQVLTTLTHIIAVTSVNSATVDVTGLVQPGDLMILSDRGVTKTGGATTAIPTDFSSLFNSVQGDYRQIISAKIANGSETVLTGMDGNTFDTKILDIFRGNIPLTAFEVSDFDEDYSEGGDPSNQVINALGTTPIVLLHATYTTAVGLANIDPRTFSPAKDGESTMDDGFGAFSHYTAWKIYNIGTTPVNHDVDIDDHGEFNRVIKGLLELT